MRLFKLPIFVFSITLSLLLSVSAPAFTPPDKTSLEEFLNKNQNLFESQSIKGSEGEEAKQIVNFLSKFYLYSLGYYLDDSDFSDRDMKALNEYRKTKKILSSGPIDKRTWTALNESTFALFDRSEVPFLNQKRFVENEKNTALPFQFLAEGTWIVKKGKKQDWPIQTTRIECNKNTMTCIEMSVVKKSYSGGAYSLNLDVNHFHIEVWNSSKIVTGKALYSMCTERNLTIDRKRKEVTSQHTFNSDLAKATGTTLCKPTESNFQTELVDGVGITNTIREFDRKLIENIGYSEKAKQLMDLVFEKKDKPIKGD